ncbi:MAG: hypothetical protein D6812_17445 [Deltaproteobacteria bacterium]|nr:MAG: hypothetical protein D6812_17445 [Deltaproteobacteria bacterium]
MVRGIVFLILIVVMATIFMVLVLGIGGDPRFFVVNTLVASGVILVLYEPVKDLVANLVTRALLKEQLALEKLLGRLSEGMIGRIELDDLLCFVTETLCATPRFVGTAVYLAEEERIFRRAAAAGERERFAAHFPSGELLSWILQSQQPIFLENSGTELPPEVLSKLTQGMAGIDAQILIPLIGKGGLLGLWAIALRPSVEETSSVEERLLLTIANQLAIGIENCRIYARMREQDQLATLGEMAAVLAHEIRNPLGAVKGAAQYLQPSLEDFQARDFLQIIIDETNRLNNVVSHFLDYAKPLTLQCVPCDVNELLRKTLVVALEGRSASVRVEWELDDAIVPIPLDVERMQGVILNLLLNAIEAMPEGGTLAIRTRQEGGTRIEIEDSGSGIPPEVRGKIFRPFFTTKVSGSGLGLAICQRIVTRHGGRIELESAPGKGTCVRLSFPMPAEARTP